MANNLIQVKRTSVSGRAANTTTLTNPGELALNMADGIMYSTNGSVVFEVGANNTNVKVTNTLTVNSISANGSVGSAGQVLHTNGTSTYWATDDQGVTSVAAGTGLSGGTITSTGTLSVNASYIATISANNASFLGGVASANYARTDVADSFGGVITFNANTVLTKSMSANGSFGSAGQVLTSGGTGNVYWSTLSSSGTVTSVATGGGLTGGTITTSGTISHADTSTQSSLTALTGANVVSDIDLDDYGHVTLLATRAITAADIGAITGNQTITLSGDLTGTGTTSINAQLVANSVGANELNVSGNGTTAQFLRSDGDGSFTWATPTDTNTTYSAGTGLTLTGTTFSIPQAVATTSDVQFDSFGVGTAASGTTGEIRATNNITAYYSDKRLKDFLGKIDNAINKVMQLNGYYYKENEVAKSLGYNNDKMQVGVSAQEVEAVLPEIVVDAPINSNFEGADYKTVYYDKLVPLLIEAIKEQQIQINMLKDQVNSLSK